MELYIKLAGAIKLKVEIAFTDRAELMAADNRRVEIAQSSEVCGWIS